MRPIHFMSLALCVAACTGSAVAGDLVITPGFKIATGGISGKVKDLTQGSAHFGLAGTVDFKLSEASSISAELGYHWFPGRQYLAESYEKLSTFPFGYTPGAIYRDRISKADGQGFELGGSYRYSFTPEFYVRGGVKVGFYTTNESNVGTELTAAAAGDPNGNTPGRLAYSSTISNVTEKKTVSPSLVLGVGYLVSPNHAVEFNVNNVRLATESVSAKTGIAYEFAYCMRF